MSTPQSAIDLEVLREAFARLDPTTPNGRAALARLQRDYGALLPPTKRKAA